MFHQAIILTVVRLYSHIQGYIPGGTLLSAWMKPQYSKYFISCDGETFGLYQSRSHSSSAVHITKCIIYLLFISL